VSTQVATDGLLKMRELAERSGVSGATIKYYLREGVLGPEDGVVRTSRNMAWYPPEFVERIQLVKRLQEERYWPLRLIREVMQSSPEEVARVISVEDRILARAVEANEATRMSAKSARETYDVPQEALDRLEEIEVLSPNGRGYDRDDVAIIEAISRFRAGGYEQSLGFTVYDTLRYRDALESLVVDEVNTLITRVAAQVDADRALEIIESADAPLRDLIGAMHSKMLLAELNRRRST
jgi:DNA-binding transcriptional MerR regulator